jgi:hypothetical protein
MTGSDKPGDGRRRVDKGLAIALAFVGSIIVAGTGLYVLSRVCIAWPATRPFAVTVGGLVIAWRAINKHL